MLNQIASIVFVLVQIACSHWLGLSTLGVTVPLVIIGLGIILGKRFIIGKRLHGLLVLISATALWAPLFTSGLKLIDANAFAQAFAQFLLAVQSLEIIRQREGVDANYLPGLGAITFALLLLSSDMVLGYRTTIQMTIGFLTSLIWVLRPELPSLFFGNSLMRHKGNTLLMLLCGVWLVGTLAERQLSSQLPSLQRHVEAMRGVEIEMVSSQSVVGMTPMVDEVGLNGRVNDRIESPETVLFEVAGTNPPGYMRTLSFTQFDGERWRNTWEGRKRQGAELQAVQATKLPSATKIKNPDGDGSSYWYMLTSQERSTSFQEYEVTIPYGRGALVPIPIGSHWVNCTLGPRTSVLLLDVHSNIWPGSVSNQRYRVLVPDQVEGLDEPARKQPSDEYMANLLRIPPSERAWIERFQAQVFGPSQRFSKRCQDVENFFTSNFQYATENEIASIRGNRTKLQTFMEERTAAHCEYFAAATVLLLRSQSIPARLSTGYLVYELDKDEEAFAARKRNAHAWAEAYDNSTMQWRVVESTPGTSEYIQRFETTETRANEANQAAISEDGWSFSKLWVETWDWLVLQAWRLIAWQHSWIIITLFILLLLSYRTFQYAHRYDGRHYSKSVRRADRLARRLGYDRGLEETCSRFARRLASDERPQAQQLATWYIHHSNQRYQSDV